MSVTQLRSSLFRTATRGVSSSASVMSTVGTAGDHPSNDTQATGIEKLELDAEKKGTELFDMGLLRAPFGTAEDPVKVQSIYNSRIVGCTGGSGDAAHDILWFDLKKGSDFSCPECSQVFTLTPMDEEM